MSILCILDFYGHKANRNDLFALCSQGGQVKYVPFKKEQHAFEKGKQLLEYHFLLFIDICWSKH